MYLLLAQPQKFIRCVKLRTSIFGGLRHAAVFSSDVSFAGAAAKVHQMCKTANEDFGGATPRSCFLIGCIFCWRSRKSSSDV
jgi:hypothetical protein